MLGQLHSVLMRLTMQQALWQQRSSAQRPECPSILPVPAPSRANRPFSSAKTRSVYRVLLEPAEVFQSRRSGARRHQHLLRPCRSTVVEAAEQMHLKALIFDCDGVILLSEDLHRVAYNAAFEHFQVRPKGKDEIANWSEAFYDKLQNSIGGGKPKMRWYFGEFGWPTSTVLDNIPESDEEKTQLIDMLQDWKTLKYQEIVSSGKVPAREGVIRLMDEARAAGLLVGVCSAATKSSAICVVESLLGKERFDSLDVFMAGDDVDKKKPDPSIYRLAAERLKVDPKECLVVEDSTIGLQAAQGAGMRCIITYTSSTSDQDFPGAERILSGFADHHTLAALSGRGPAFDDRKAEAAPA